MSDDNPAQQKAITQLYEARKYAAQVLLEADTASVSGPLVEASYDGVLNTANAAVKNLIMLLGDRDTRPPSFDSPRPIINVRIPRDQERSSARRNSNTITYSVAGDAPERAEITDLKQATAWMGREIMYRTPPVRKREIEVTEPVEVEIGGEVVTGQRVIHRETVTEPAPPAEDTLRMKFLFGISNLEDLFQRCDAAMQELGLGIDIDTRDRDGEGF
jgi:hypothetical protein